MNTGLEGWNDRPGHLHHGQKQTKDESENEDQKDGSGPEEGGDPDRCSTSKAECVDIKNIAMACVSTC